MTIAWLFSLIPVFSPADLPRGVVIDTVVCVADKTQTYALYIPKTFDTSVKGGAIFFHEPGARAKLPVGMYREIAERYGLVLACSYNSRNGPHDRIVAANKAMATDLIARLPLSTDRLLIAGMSGGARAALAIGMASNFYRGIIACGAGSMGTGGFRPTNKIPYAALAGIRDINLLEMLEDDEVLTKSGYPHMMFVFEGKHEWPPADAMTIAVHWQLIQMKVLTAPSVKMGIKKLLQAQIDSGDVFIAARNARQVKLIAMSGDSLTTVFSADPKFKSDESAFSAAVGSEIQWRQQFYDLMGRVAGARSRQEFDEEGFRRIAMISAGWKNSKKRQERMLAERVETMVRIAGFERHRSMWDSEDYFHAALVAEVMLLFEKSPTVYFLHARDLAAIGEKKNAVRELKRAADSGFNGLDQVTNDKFLSPLTAEKGFNAILEQIKSNQAGAR